MAVYYLNLKTFGRAGGSSAVSAAAYRAGERIRDERTGRTYDHSGRQGVLHKEILVPGDLRESGMDWAMDRAYLWNAAEAAESRKNARVAREYLVALPAELDPEQRLRMVRAFSQELTDRYRFALDLAVHAPRDFPGSDPRNFHAHLLATTREATPDGLTTKTTLEFNDSKRRELGLEPVIHELLFVRERWAAVTNEALRDAGIEARVDHRSLAAQGIDREPYPYIPRAAYEMERHGYRSALAERMRMEYQTRVQARLERTASRERAASLESPGPNAARDRGAEGASAGAGAGAGAGAARLESPDEVRRQSREDSSRLSQDGAGQRAKTSDEVRRQARDEWLQLSRERERQHAKTPDEVRRQAREEWLQLGQERERQHAKTPEEVRRQSREDWLRLNQDRDRQAAKEPARVSEHRQDDDFAL